MITNGTHQELVKEACVKTPFKGIRIISLTSIHLFSEIKTEII